MSISPVSSSTSPSATGSAAKTSPQTPRQRALRQATDELVGSVFFGEVFKAMRESTLKGKYGHGGRGEEIFSAQLHEVLAKNMGRSARLGLGDAIYRRYVGNL